MRGRLGRCLTTCMPCSSGCCVPQLDQRVGSVLGDHRLVAKNPQGAWQREWGDSNSTTPVSPTRGQGSVGGATCSFAERPVSAPARCCPPFTRRLRTQHGPRVRFRLVADAFGAPVLRDQAADQPGGTAGPITVPVARREL
jgi:hypothetical protein